MSDLSLQAVEANWHSNSNLNICHVNLDRSVKLCFLFCKMGARHNIHFNASC